MRKVVLVFAILLGLTLLAPDALAEDTVSSYDIACIVNQDGSRDLTLTVTMAFASETNSVTLPLPGTVETVKASGLETSLSTDDEGNQSVVLIDTDGFSGTRTLVVTFSSASPLSDSAAITYAIPLLSSHWNWDIPSFTFSVTLPAEFDGSPVYESGYYGTLSEDDLSVTAENVRISGSVPEGIMAFDSFSVSLDFPDGYFTVSGAVTRYTISFPGLFNILSLLLLAVAAFYWFRCCRIPVVSVRSRALPPDGATAGDLPFFLDGSAPNTAALILEWAVSGYLKIYLRGNRVVLRRRMIMGNERKAYEIRLFESMFRSGTVCELPDADCRKACAAARKQMRRTWRRRLFDRRRNTARLLRLLSALSLGGAGVVFLYCLLPKAVGWTIVSILFLLPFAFAGLLIQHCAGDKLRRPWERGLITPVAAAGLLLGLAGLFIGAWMLLFSVLLQLYVGWQTAFGDKRTKVGIESMRQLLGFRRYLLNVSQDRLRTCLRQDPMYYYRILPYAEALGMGRVFSNRFGKLPIEGVDWYRTGRSHETAVMFYEALEPVLEALRT